MKLPWVFNDWTEIDITEQVISNHFVSLKTAFDHFGLKIDHNPDQIVSDLIVYESLRDWHSTKPIAILLPLLALTWLLWILHFYQTSP